MFITSQETLNYLKPDSHGKNSLTLAGVTQLVGASSCRLKGRGFDFPPVHGPRLRVQSLAREPTRRQSIDVSLSLPPPPPSSPLFLKAMKKCPWVRIILKKNL